MLENCRALLLVKFGRVSARQPIIEFVFDRQPNLGARLRFLPPVNHERLFQPLQKLARDFLYCFAFFVAQVGTGTREKVEDRQLCFRELLADVTLLFFVQPAAECEEFLEQFLNRSTASVVRLD